jgi:hypothetical protein
MKLINLSESKSSIIALGYPILIAKLFFKKFGKNAYLIARWYKEYTTAGYPERKDWFNYHHDWASSSKEKLSDLLFLYNNTKNPDEHRSARKSLNLWIDPNDDYNDLDEIKEFLADHIEHVFFNELFFRYYSLIKAIESGKVTDLNPYKNLHFHEAQEKYETYNFKTIKKYKNGYKWVDVGSKCTLVGKLIKNCGSAGVMGTDPERTLLVLFDQNNSPRVILTYQPNEKEIKSPEGTAGSEVNKQFHKYILDLAKTLNVSLNIINLKSKLLKVKYMLKDLAKNIRTIKKDTYSELFQFDIKGVRYYSDGYKVASMDQVLELANALKSKKINKDDIFARNINITTDALVSALFSYKNTSLLKHTLNLEPYEIETFLKSILP